MRPHRIKTALSAAALVLVAVAALATLAGATTSLKGNLLVSFEGEIIPSSLPRSGAAPVQVQMSGSIKTTDKSTPPKLERISLQINRHGSLNPDHLPDCPLAAILTGSSSGAREVCGRSLVGHGNVTSRVALPEQTPTVSVGGMLAFNGHYHGRPAIFAQVVSGPPLPLTYVIIFEVKKSRHGEFATALDATLPPIASGYGQISSFFLTLERKFQSGGHTASYATATCPAPKGITEVGFKMARATYSFANGVQMSTELTKKCKVRG